MVPTRHQLLITEPIDGVEPNQPITRIIDANVYVRPDKGGLMLGGYERTPIQYDMARVAPSFDIKDMPLDLDVLRALARSVREQLPIFAELGRGIGLREHRGGLPTMTADGEHTVGPVPDVRGLFVAGGCCVGGLSIAPAVGEVLAQWIISGRSPMDLAALAPGRASSDPGSEERLSEACRAQYSHHYWESHEDAASSTKNDRPLSRARLFGDDIAGTAEFRREVLQLRQAVAHGQHGLGIVDVNAGNEVECRERGREHVHEAERRMIGHQVAAAFRAILALAERCLGEGRDVLGSRFDPHGSGLPKAEGVHRPPGPGTARPAMTIAHGLG